MKKDVIGKFLMLMVLMATFCFCQVTCFAGQINPDKQQKKQLVELFDTLSRKCEAEYFRQGELTNDKLITYANVHSTGSSYAAHPDREGKYRLPAGYVDKITIKYFGKKVEHKSVANYPYRKGYYMAHVADAGETSRIEITGFESLGNDLYLAHASYYDESDNNLFRKDKALLKKVTSAGKSRFIVLEYQKDQ
jgi:hypothetical protein